MIMKSISVVLHVSAFFLAIAICQGEDLEIPAQRANWGRIWVPNNVDLSKPRQEYVKSVGTLGNDLAGKKWQTVSTKYNLIHYQNTIDKAKLKQVAQCLDDLYEFLKLWNPNAPDVPIKTFLVPDERGRSRCCKETNSMRTGDKGDAAFITTSLLHEETHLFNFAYLNKQPQGWWAGEFSCVYFQERARLEAEHADIRRHVKSILPDGPKTSLGGIAPDANKKIDDYILGEAFSAMYFLHSKYGDQKLREFRTECLRLAKTKGVSASDSDAPFKTAFGVGFDELDPQWRQFYGWIVKDNLKTTEESSKPEDLQPMELTRRIVAELSSPEYQGRAAGGPGEERAGAFIADNFHRIGLESLAPDGKYFQPFNVPYRDLVGPIGLKIRDRDYTYKTDFGVLDGGPAEWLKGDMCFVGFGTENNYESSLAANKLKGKILVALSQDKNHPNDRQAANLAKKTGAIGILLIDPPALHDPTAFARKYNKLKNEMPVLHVSPKVGEFILSLDKAGLTNLFEQLRAGNHPDISIQGLCQLAAGTVYAAQSKSCNVLGQIKDSKPRKQHMLIFAHYDGQGKDGRDGFYPGANDNASGVAVLLATASLLTSRQAELQSDVYFAALGAEEVGCVGARLLLDSNLIHWNQIDLALCLDMVGNAQQKQITLQTPGAEAPAYIAFKDYAEIQRWNVKPFVRKTLGSDAEVIQRSGAPILFIISESSRQHTVIDDAGNTDPQHMAQLAKLLAGFILHYGSNPDTRPPGLNAP
jgi:aminopeptidase YwaD